MLDVQRLKHMMQTHQVASPPDLVGVCAEEIARLQTRLGLVFPASYQQFYSPAAARPGCYPLGWRFILMI